MQGNIARGLSSLQPERRPQTHKEQRTRRVLLLSNVFPPQHGGSGRWLWEVYRRFPKEDVLMMGGQSAGAEAFDQTHDRPLIRAPLTFTDWGILTRQGLNGYWQALSSVRRAVAEHGVSELHCCRAVPEGFVAWMLKKVCGVPYVCFSHGEELNYYQQSRQGFFLASRVLKSARRIISNSENTKRVLVESWGQPADTIRVLHPGVDTTQFVPAAYDEERQRQLGWHGKSVVLTAGRLQKRKGQDTMIRALPCVRDQVPNVLYAIAGDGEERADLEQLAIQLGVGDNVQFLGAIDDEQLIACYQQCDIFVLANREVEGDFEGFGMVLLEAQACGKPVIAGKSGGTAETLQPGVTGYVIPCEGPHLLAEKVAELLKDANRRNEMGRAARQWVVQHFDWSVLAARASELLVPSVKHEPSARTMAPLR
jgi:phosphatidylinositol alpha-1,6-mannosyltransferase